jgi:RNA polymerase sigma-70 factor (ECF subfamily)
MTSAPDRLRAVVEPGFKKSDPDAHPWSVLSETADSPPAAAAAPGSPEFAAIFREYAPFVWRALRRMGVEERDTEDVLQEVFVAVHKKLATFEQRSTLRTWLYGICLHKALDHRRRAHVRHEVMNGTVPERSSPPRQEHAVLVTRARERLDAVLETLDDAKRAVFVLFEWEGLSMHEIAELTATPLQTAYARLYAARAQVQRALADEEGGSEP